MKGEHLGLNKMVETILNVRGHGRFSKPLESRRNFLAMLIEHGLEGNLFMFAIRKQSKFVSV